MGLDPRLEKRLKNLEGENKLLKQEVITLKNTQPIQGNRAQRGIRGLLKISTLGKVQHPELYIPSNPNMHPAPRRSRRRLF